MISFKLTVDSKNWDIYKKKLLSLTESGVKIGILGGQHETLSLLELAAIHEFGAPSRNIPERSFIRSTVFANKTSYGMLVGKLVKQGNVGAWAILGQKIVSDIKNQITSGAGIPPPLKPTTINRKGSSRPLVDTGQLLNSITYEVISDG